METTVTAKHDAAVQARITAARIEAARVEAARGGWPEGASCSFQSGRKTVWAWTVATFFGAGFGKPGPGTWGSVAATLIWAGVSKIGESAHSVNAYFVAPYQIGILILTLAGIVLSIGLGVPAATIAARESGSKDPGFVVIDEVAGQWITMLPLCWGKHDWKHILISLLLFRVFDVWKPFPIRRI
jgi:phosphatidylglycerophosphatase A